MSFIADMSGVWKYRGGIVLCVTTVLCVFVADVHALAQSCKKDSDCSRYNYCNIEHGEGRCSGRGLVELSRKCIMEY